jgi:hypothetical protein
MGRASILFALALPMTGLAALAQAMPTGVVTLAALRDRVRPLLIFAPKPDDPQLEIQLRRLQQNAAVMAERDVLPVAIPYNAQSPTAAMLSDTDAVAARRRFHVARDEFVVILVGKDGGEKLRSKEPFSAETLRTTIDAMPMRQDEMRARTQSKP